MGIQYLIFSSLKAVDNNVIFVSQENSKLILKNSLFFFAEMLYMD